METSMRTRAILTFLLVGVCGCTHTQLRRDTISVGSTISDIQYQMVLSNIAMFKVDENALPWGIKLTQGSIGVNDSADSSFTYTWPGTSRQLGVSGSRQLSQSWTVVPVTKPDELEKLQGVYRTAAKAD